MFIFYFIDIKFTPNIIKFLLITSFIIFYNFNIKLFYIPLNNFIYYISNIKLLSVSQNYFNNHFQQLFPWNISSKSKKTRAIELQLSSWKRMWTRAYITISVEVDRAGKRGSRQERSNVFRHRRSGWIVHGWRPIESSRTRVERHGNSTQTASMIVCRAITQAVVLGLGLVQVYAGIPRGAVRLAHYSPLTRASRPCSWTSRWQTRDLAHSRNLLWHPENSSSAQGNWSIYNGPELYRRNVDYYIY